MAGPVESLNGPYSVSLAFNPTAVYEGVVQGYTQSGVVVFTNLRVVSKGSFSLVASSTGITSGSVAIGPLSTFAYSLSASASSLTPSANFPFTVTVLVNSEDSSLFTGSLTIVVSCDSTFIGTSSLENTSGTNVFTLRFSVPGGKYLKVTAGSLTSSMILTVLPCVIKVTSFTAVIPNQPSLSTTTFSLSIGVYDNSGTTLESQYNTYPISISLITGTLSGLQQKSTTSGATSFTSLRVLSSGTFTILAESPSLTSVSTLPFTVSNSPYSLSIESSSSSPSSYFGFTLTVTIYGEDSALYLGSASIVLTESTNTIRGQLSATTTTGSSNLVIYFVSSGSKTVRVTVGSVFQNVVVNVLQSKLKIVKLSPIVSDK